MISIGSKIKALLLPACLTATALFGNTSVVGPSLLNGVSPHEDSLGQSPLAAYGTAFSQWRNPAEASPGLALGFELEPSNNSDLDTKEYLGLNFGTNWMAKDLDDAGLLCVLGVQGLLATNGDTVRDSQGVTGKSFSNTQSLVGFHGAIGWRWFRIGVATKWYDETLDSVELYPFRGASSGLVDAGALVDLSEFGVVLSLAGRNLVQPTDVKGALVPIAKSYETGLRFAFDSQRFYFQYRDAELPEAGRVSAAVGAGWEFSFGDISDTDRRGKPFEFGLEDRFNFRLGYEYDISDPSPSLKGLGAGLGTPIGFFGHLDFSALLLGELGCSFRLSGEQSF